MTDPMPAVADEPHGLDRVLGLIPRALASHVHILWLLALGVVLIVLPLLGVHVSTQTELIGGNYTNVTSDIGACIAAGGTLHLIRTSKRRHMLEAERLRLTHELHQLLTHVHAEYAATLGIRSPEN